MMGQAAGPSKDVMYLADLDKATNVKFVTILKETLGSPPNLFGLSNIERQIRVITTFSPETLERNILYKAEDAWLLVHGTARASSRRPKSNSQTFLRKRIGTEMEYVADHIFALLLKEALVRPD